MTDVLARDTAPAGRRPTVRVVWLTVCALLVSLAGLAAPAAAASEPIAITGRVVLPAGYTYSSALPPYVEPYYLSSGRARSLFASPRATVAADGTFSLTVQPGREDRDGITSYYLLLTDRRQQLVSGFLGAGGATVPFHTDAVAVSRISSGVELRARLGAQVTGRLALPAGYVPERRTDLRVAVSVGGFNRPTSRTVQGLVNDDLTFTVGGFEQGEKVRVSVADYSDRLFGGSYSATGDLEPWGGAAAELTAPVSGLVIELHHAGALAGRVEVPALLGTSQGLRVGAVVDERGRDHYYDYPAPDGSFSIGDLDTGRDYALEVSHADGEVERSLLGTDGSLVPVGGTSASYAAAWARAAKFRPPASGMVLSALPALALRGTVTAPEGFTFDPWAADAPRVFQYSRDDETGEWVRGLSFSVDADRRFRLLGVEAGEEYLLYFEPNATGVAARARFGRGFWTGNDSALTADPAKARAITPNRVRDLVIPLATRNVTRPSVTGTPTLGKKLWVDRGTWDPAPVSNAVQWLRDGAAISGATGSSYTVTKSDLGRSISARVTVRGPQGYTRTSATTAAVSVRKVTPEVSVWVPSGIEAGDKVQVAVRVSADSVTSAPLGTVKVRVGSATRTVTLTASHAGRISVTMPAQKKGSHEVRAAYTPSSSAAPFLTSRTSPTITLRVT